MNAADVYRFVHLRPEDCVCRGLRQVMVRRAGRLVGPVVSCPQCTDPAGLELFVAREERSAPTGGAA